MRNNKIKEIENEQYSKVFFRCDQVTSDYDGVNSRNWPGDDSYLVDVDKIGGHLVTQINYYEFDNFSTGQVWSNNNLLCEIPMTSVGRVYYSFEDEE